MTGHLSLQHRWQERSEQVAYACTKVLINCETPFLGNKGVWAGIFEVGSTQSWEVLEVGTWPLQECAGAFSVDPGPHQGVHQSQELAGQDLGLPCCL